MIVNARLPLLNLHQVGVDAAGAQIPGSSAKTPICDFRSVNEITIWDSHLNSVVLDLIECGSAAEEGQALHIPHPTLFYRCAFGVGDLMRLHEDVDVVSRPHTSHGVIGGCVEPDAPKKRRDLLLILLPRARQSAGPAC